MTADEKTLNEIVRSTTELLRATPGPLRRAALHVDGASVELEWHGPGDEVTLDAASAVGAAVAAAADAVDAMDEDAEALPSLKAPMVGTFYHAPEPGAEPYVRTGDVVEPGQQIGVLEAMKLMNRVDAEFGGTVVEILVDDGVPVEFGQPLILLGPAGS